MPGNWAKYLLHNDGRLAARDGQALCQAEGGNAIGNPVIHHLRLAAHLACDSVKRNSEDARGGGGVNVDVFAERLEHGRFLRERGDDPQFYLGIVSRKKEILRPARYERFANLAPAFGPDGNILQIRVLGIEPASGGGGLLERGMNATCPWPDGGRQGIDIGRFELGHAAIFEQTAHDLVIRG